MIKNTLKITITIMFLGLFGYFGYQIITKINYKKTIASNIKTIPQFSYVNTKGGIFTKDSIQPNTPTIFIYYNSDCDYCNNEAQMIHENIDTFNKIQILFVSFENPDRIKKFAHQHQLNHYDNVTFLHDNKLTFAATFDVTSLPCLVMYDKNQKLIEKIKGQIKPETLIKKLIGIY